MKLGFKRTINWYKYQSKVTAQAQNQYLDYLLDPSFQGVNRLFVLSYEDNAHRTSQKRYFFPTVEIEDYNVIIDGRDFVDQPKINDLKAYDNIRKIAAGQGDDYAAVCLLNCPHFKEHCKMIAIDLSKKQALDADPKAMEQINFSGNPDEPGNIAMFFIIEE